jgi:hypothetical protein
MDISFLSFSDEYFSLIPSGSDSEILRDFFMLPHKRKLREEYNGYPASRFYTTPPSEFLCAICENILKKPYECKKCGKLFCEGCANKSKKIDPANGSRSFLCSICGSKQEPRVPSVVLVRMISELKIKCQNFDSGCREIVCIDEINKHELLCPYKEVFCANSKICRKSGLIKNFIQTESVNARNMYSHSSSRLQNRYKCYACSSKCSKIVAFEKQIAEKHYQKALKEYHSVLIKQRFNNPNS